MTVTGLCLQSLGHRGDKPDLSKPREGASPGQACEELIQGRIRVRNSRCCLGIMPTPD